MRQVYSWSAKRAGGRITIYGRDEQGSDIRIVGVDKIEGRGVNPPIATDKDGAQYQLR